MSRAVRDPLPIFHYALLPHQFTIPPCFAPQPLYQSMKLFMSNAMPVSEESILKPRPPNLHNSDDWPAFSLGKVTITSQLNGEQVSLLSAHKGNPLKVSGRLVEVEDEQLPLRTFTEKTCGGMPSNQYRY